MQRLLLILSSVFAVGVLSLGAFAFASRDSANRDQTHVCQLAIDAVRAAVQFPTDTTFEACGGDGMIVIETNQDTYDVTGFAYVPDADGNIQRRLFMVSVWRTADGWASRLNYLRE